jgi:hypothetical protein
MDHRTQFLRDDALGPPRDRRRAADLRLHRNARRAVLAVRRAGWSALAYHVANNAFAVLLTVAAMYGLFGLPA